MTDDVPKPRGKLATILLGRVDGLTNAEKRFGGALRIVAVCISMVVGGLTLYSRFKSDDPARVPELLFLTDDKAHAREAIRAGGGARQVRPEAFKRATRMSPGQEGYALGWYVKARDNCILTKFVIQLISDVGLTVPLSPLDVSNVRVQPGAQMTALPITIPKDTPLGDYQFYLAVAYQCGANTQVIPFQTSPVEIK